MKISRRTALISAGVAGVAGASWIATRPGDAPRGRFEKPSGKRYNILFVLSDQERAWTMYPTGFIDRHTPARAWLRDNGVNFTAFQTPNALCSPARGVISSGAHSPENGLWDNTPLPYSSPLHIDRPTIGTLLQDAGYITGYAGKWHLSHTPNEEQATADDRKAFNETIKSYGFTESEVVTETDGPLAGWEHDGRTVGQALTFLKRRTSGEKPWFLSVNLLNPHDIMFYTSGDAMTKSRVSQFPDASARPPVQDPLYAEDLGYPLTDNFGPKSFGNRPDAVREFGLSFSEALGHFPYDDAAAGRDMQNFYWNCTRDCDRQLARLLDAVKASGQMEDTIIVFTSDHGEILGTHGQRGKGTGVFREQCHVPAIIVHPEAGKGIEVKTPLSHVDWVPTLLSLAGVKERDLKAQMPMIVGHDFSPLIFDPTADHVRNRDGVLLMWTSLVFQNHESVRIFDGVRRKPALERPLAMRELMQTGLPKRGQMRGIYDGRWKFARYSSPLEIAMPKDLAALRAGYDIELYDTKNDPAELVNLATNPQAAAETIITLNRRLNQLITREIGVDDGSFIPLYVRV